MMAHRYTQRDLDGAVRGLNLMAGFTAEESDAPLWIHTRGEDSRAMVGRYYVSGAYGGWKLVQIVSEAGAERSITDGYGTKREVYHLIHAYREGMAASGDDRYSLAALREAIPAERERSRKEREAWAARLQEVAG
jgi:hypothetical protein